MTSDVNPVQLKIALATRGARLDGALRAALTAVPDFIPRAVDLTLPDDVRVLVPIDEAAIPSAPYMVASENGHRPQGVVTYEARDAENLAKVLDQTLSSRDVIAASLPQPQIPDTLSVEVQMLVGA